jgi:hypothetical protein
LRDRPGRAARLRIWPVIHELWRHGHDDVGYALVVTSEDDRLAQRLCEAAGFRRTEREGGSLMLAYERDL